MVYVAAAMLAACGGSQPPIGAPGATAQSSLPATCNVGKSWMLPEAKGEDLLYAPGWSRASGFLVAVFSYPRGKLVGTLTFGCYSNTAGVCFDASGDVFIPVNFESKYAGSDIYEYARGGTEPIEMLTDSGLAWGCAVDSTTGNLAVANVEPYGGGYPGNVAIYPDAQGTPTYYTDTKLDFPLYCTYDDEGNLFVSADDPDIIGELSEGSGSFENVTVNEDIDAASLQWDDGHLVAASYGGGSYSDTQNVYQVQISGASGTVISQTVLQIRSRHKVNRRLEGAQFWVQGSVIIGPNFSKGRPINAISFWPYPKGGKPTRNLMAQGISFFRGVAVDLAK
jgi:hypothetical protein